MSSRVLVAASIESSSPADTSLSPARECDIKSLKASPSVSLTSLSAPRKVSNLPYEVKERPGFPLAFQLFHILLVYFCNVRHRPSIVLYLKHGA